MAYNSVAASLEQIDLMLDFFSEHQDLAKGSVPHVQGRYYAQQMWLELTEKLNAVKGDGYHAVKTVDQWKKVWKDKKQSAKRAIIAARTIGSDRALVQSARRRGTDIDSRVLAIMGDEWAQALPQKIPQPTDQSASASLATPKSNRTKSFSIVKSLPSDQEQGTNIEGDYSRSRISSSASAASSTLDCDQEIEQHKTPVVIRKSTVNAAVAATRRALRLRASAGTAHGARACSAESGEARIRKLKVEQTSPPPGPSSPSELPPPDLQDRLLQYEQKKLNEMVAIRQSLQEMTGLLRKVVGYITENRQKL